MMHFRNGDKGNTSEGRWNDQTEQTSFAPCSGDRDSPHQRWLFSAAEDTSVTCQPQTQWSIAQALVWPFRLLVGTWFKKPGVFFKKPNPVGFWVLLGFLDKQEKIRKIIQKLSNLKP